MDFTQNYFDLFGVPQQYPVDKKQLSIAYRDLQKEFHPDKFVSHSASEQRLAVQFAAYINSAYDTLRSSVARAEYLLSLVGVVIDDQSVTISDMQFLMLQIEWRESLQEVSSLSNDDEAEAQLDDLSATVQQSLHDVEQAFEHAYMSQQYSDAQEAVAKLHFIDKMLREIEMQASLRFD